MFHRIEAREVGSDGHWEFSIGNLACRHRTDGMRKLLRLMVAEGMTGEARTFGPNGGCRMMIPDIATAARFAVGDGDKTGVKVRPFVAWSDRIGGGRDDE